MRASKQIDREIFALKMQAQTSSEAKLEETKMEVGTGEPGYRWTTGYYVHKPDGTKLYPPMTRKDALAFCKAQGWKPNFGEG